MKDVVISILSDIQPGRLIESMIFLAVCIWKIKPHLLKIETRMQGLENCMNSIKDNVSLGFTQGNARFNRIETRLEILESTPKTKQVGIDA